MNVNTDMCTDVCSDRQTDGQIDVRSPYGPQINPIMPAPGRGQKGNYIKLTTSVVSARSETLPCFFPSIVCVIF